MNDGSHKGFAAKHGGAIDIDTGLREAVAANAKNGRLACAAAFAIAKDLAMTPAEVGRAADLMEYRLTHCQLGLFGYQPEKKIISPAGPVPEPLAAAIGAALAHGRLPCKAAWAIADQLGLGKRAVSSACETLEIKIKPCQLGAF